MNKSVYRVRIEVFGEPAWIIDPDRSWDGSAYSRRPEDAKIWKTERGALNWLCERPSVTGQVEVVSVPTPAERVAKAAAETNTDASDYIARLKR